MMRGATTIMLVAALVLATGCKSCKKPRDADGATAKKTDVGVVQEKGSEPPIPDELKFDPSVEMLEESCEAGSAAQCETLGDKLFAGDGIKQDMERALKLYESASVSYEKQCEGGQPMACRSLALMWQTGKGVAKDELEAERLMRKALSIYRRSCEAGNHLDCCWAATYYLDNEVIKKNEPRGKEYQNRGFNEAKIACESDKPEGCNALAMMYKEGMCGIEKDPDRSEELLEKARNLLTPD